MMETTKTRRRETEKWGKQKNSFTVIRIPNLNINNIALVTGPERRAESAADALWTF